MKMLATLLLATAAFTAIAAQQSPPPIRAGSTSLGVTFNEPVSGGTLTPLWDGKTLKGWHVIGKGEWKVEEGAIHGVHLKSEKEFSHLVTDREFTNFFVRLKFKSLKGNSGLYFRIIEQGFSGVTGFQAEIDARNDIGGLYETNGRSWVSKPTADDVKTWLNPDAWNDMTVTAKGGDITVTVNGKTTAQLKNDPGRKAGKFALQVHGGQDCDVWFKDIQIAELP